MRRTTTDADDTDLSVDEMLRIEAEIDNERRTQDDAAGARGGGGGAGDDDEGNTSDVDVTYLGTLTQPTTGDAAMRAADSEDKGSGKGGAAATSADGGVKARRQGQGSRGGSNPPRRMGDPDSNRESIRRCRNERMATVFTTEDVNATIMNELINSSTPTEVCASYFASHHKSQDDSAVGCTYKYKLPHTTTHTWLTGSRHPRRAQRGRGCPQRRPHH